MPLIRQLLAFNAYSEGWALYAEQLADELGAYENDPRRAARLSAVDRLPRLPAGRRHRHPRQALDARAGRAVLRRRERIESARSRERSRSLLLVARPGVRLQGRAQRDQPPARARRRRRSARSTTSRRSTTPWCSAATCRSTCSRRTSTNISGPLGSDCAGDLHRSRSDVRSPLDLPPEQIPHAQRPREQQRYRQQR